MFHVCLAWWFVAVRDRAVIDGISDHHRRPVTNARNLSFFYNSVRVQSAQTEVIAIHGPLE